MPSETARAKRARARRILNRLHALYPNPRTILSYSSDFELVVAVILSAQATDISVNKVTPGLFRLFPNPDALAEADEEELVGLLAPVGLARSKARALKETARALRDTFGGKVPRTLEELLMLRGVGRKSALVILGEGFGIAQGIAVDTHVNRLSNRLGLTTRVDPVKVEQDLLGIISRNDWIAMNHLFIFHGRAICRARFPGCEECVLSRLCPSAFVAGG